MDENFMTNEVAEQVCDELVDNTVQDLTVIPQDNAVASGTSNDIGKMIASGMVGLAIGGAAGAAIDHWVVPKLKKAWLARKEKKAKKKAEKEAKKTAKPEGKDQASKTDEHFNVMEMKESDFQIDELPD